MKPTFRLRVIRLLERIRADREMADRLQIADASYYRVNGMVEREGL